ncbi:MAG TPA: hypothetical protein VF692_00110 [Pyrinomonadaceae bacterium]|jgi:hypothetical protein
MENIICGECGEIHNKCSAHKKRKNSADGELHPCNKSPMPNGCCDIHGGKALSGIASPRFKTGQHLKYLPKGLGEKYLETLNDPDINMQREGIAIIGGLMKERFEKLYKGESREFWAELKGIYLNFVDDFKKIRELHGTEDEFPDIIGDFTFEEMEYEKDEERREQLLERACVAIARMGEVIERGRETWDVYEKVADMIELQAKLKERENKRLKDLDQMISAEKAMLLIGHIAGIIQRHVKDPSERAAISLELAATVIS